MATHVKNKNPHYWNYLITKEHGQAHFKTIGFSVLVFNVVNSSLLHKFISKKDLKFCQFVGNRIASLRMKEVSSLSEILAALHIK